MTATITYDKYFLCYLETLIINVVFSIWEQKQPLLFLKQLETVFFLLFAREGWKNQICFWGRILNGHLWPSIIYSFKFFVRLFFLHITHMNVKLISQNFHRFWSMTSNPKSPNTCNFEGYLKLETPKFQHWQFFISHLNVNFSPPKTSRWKSRTISPSQIFQNLKFYMISMHVCEGWSIIWSVTILFKCQLRVKHHSRPKWFIAPLVSPTYSVRA